MKCHFLSLAALAAAGPVSKVVELLGDLKVKVAEDLKTTEAQVEEYKVYCREEQRDRGFSIKAAQKEMDQNSAIAENAAAKISTSASELQAAGARAAEAEEELKAAKATEEEAQKGHSAAIKELKDAIDMISRAVSVLKREMASFLQGGKSNKEIDNTLQKMLPALSTVVMSANIEGGHQLNAFMESNETQPQAKQVVYESKTGGVVDMLVDLREKAEDQLKARQKQSTQSKFDFEMLQQSLKAEVTNAEEAAADAKKVGAKAGETKAAAEGAFAEAEASKNADVAFVDTLKMSCKKTADSWSMREKEGKEEIKAIEQAIEILQGGVKVSLAQLSSKKKLFKAASKELTVRDELSSLLKKLGKKWSNFSLMELADSAEKDPFVKVRGMINKMIAKLEKEATEEATKDTWCKEEKAKSEKSQASKKDKVDEYQARVDTASAKLEQLAASVQELTEELSEIQTTTANAQKLRSEQAAEFKKSEAEYSQSIEAVSKAISVLSEFYEGTSFLEQPAAPEIRSAKSMDAGAGIISILETAMSDFSKTLTEKKMDEADQQETFDKLMQESKVNTAAKSAELKGKESMISSVKQGLSSSQEDLKSSTDELDAVLEYIEKLKPQCTIKVETYQERKQRRENEIAGLNDALDILASEN